MRRVLLSSAAVVALLGTPSPMVQAASAPAKKAPAPASEPRCDHPPAPRESTALAAKMRAEVRSTARDGYESTDALFDVVEGAFPDISGCLPAPHTQPLTNAVSSRVRAAAGAPFSHLTHLSFVPGRVPDEPSPAVGDIYLHADGGEPRYVAIRGVDFRKWMFQDIVLRDCDAPDAVCDRERLPGPESAWVGAEPVPESVAGLPFDSDRFACIRNVHGYFAEFNRITKKVRELGDIGVGDRLFHVTNNCREPGNYELALVSRSEGKLWGNHISLDLDFYARLMADIEVELGDLGTGLRVVGSHRRPDGTYSYEEVAPKAFPGGCGLENLAPFIGSAQRLRGTVDIAVDDGPIPWTEFPAETVAKSGKGPDEGIVYVRHQPQAGVAYAFRDGSSYLWQLEDGTVERLVQGRDEPAGPGVRWRRIAAPRFSDTRGTLGISAFEVDGRYLTRLPDRVVPSGAARLYTFDYSWLAGLTRAEVRETIRPDGSPANDPAMLEFRLLDDRGARNLVVGNVALGPGEETAFVVGIGTQPLRDMYDSRVLQEAQRYALTFDAGGAITDLAGSLGLGLVIVRRGAGDDAATYTVDLVSYERAVPLWRGTVTVAR